jgi:hypothetical protein
MECDLRIEALGFDGKPILDCTSEEWHGGLRDDLQKRAGEWIDQGQHLRAQIALSEVQRLDAKWTMPDAHTAEERAAWDRYRSMPNTRAF